MQMSTSVTLSFLSPHVYSWVGTLVPTAIQQPLGIEGTARTTVLGLVASPQGLSPAQRVLVATSWERGTCTFPPFGPEFLCLSILDPCASASRPGDDRVLHERGTDQEDAGGVPSNG
jgi:hypothetical protein